MKKYTVSIFGFPGKVINDSVGPRDVFTFASGAEGTSCMSSWIKEPTVAYIIYTLHDDELNTDRLLGFYNGIEP